MPLVWASRLKGEPVPERVAGSSLIALMADRAAKAGASIYLLGGDSEAAEGAERLLKERCPKLRIAGRSSPRVSSPPSAAEVDAISEALVDASPDIVLVALKQTKEGKKEYDWPMIIDSTCTFRKCRNEPDAESSRFTMFLRVRPDLNVNILNQNTL